MAQVTQQIVRTRGSAEYVIALEGGMYRIRDHVGKVVQNETDPDTAFQAWLTSLSADANATIHIKGAITFNAAQTMINSKSKLTITTDRLSMAAQSAGDVIFTNLTFYSETDGVENVRLIGLFIITTNFVIGAGGPIQNVNFFGCTVNNASGHAFGVQVTDISPGTNFIMNIYFDFCHFWDRSGTETEGAMILILSNQQGNGQFYFTKCMYWNYEPNCVFLRVGNSSDQGELDSVWVDDMTWTCGLQTGLRIFVLGPASKLVAWIDRVLIEPKRSITIFDIENGTDGANMRFVVHLTNVKLTDADGYTTTLITNAAVSADWATWVKNELYIDNLTRYAHTGGIFALGTPGLIDGKFTIRLGTNIFSPLGLDEWTHGQHEVMQVGEAVVFGETLYIKTTDDKLWKSDADDEATMPVVAMAAMAGAADAWIIVLIRGRVYDSTYAFPSGGLQTWASLTPGDLTVTPPSDIDDMVQPLGWTYNSEGVQFAPSMVMVKVVVP